MVVSFKYLINAFHREYEYEETVCLFPNKDLLSHVKGYSETYSILFSNKNEMTIQDCLDYFCNTSDISISECLLDLYYFMYLNYHSNTIKYLNQYLKFLGTITEVAKLYILDVKLDLSILYSLKNNSAELTSDLIPIANSLLWEIDKKYENDKIVDARDKQTLNYKIENSIRNIQFNLCCLTSRNQKKDEYIFYIDFKNIDLFINRMMKFSDEVIKKMNDEEITAKSYMLKGNCFCLATCGRKLFFSLSSFKDNTKNVQNFVKKVIDDFDKDFQGIKTLQYCYNTSKTKCYGYFDKNKVFIKEKNISYYDQNYDNLLEQNEYNKKSNLFRCCERKIFPFVSSDKITIFCKFDPCVQCKPLIKDESNRFTDFKFITFAKSQKDFLIHIRNEGISYYKKRKHIRIIR